MLLIACANIANLTLARLVRRSREMALRSALGADRARLFRQLLAEGGLLALAGGVLGLGFAAGTMRLLTGFAARFTPRAGEIALDGEVLAFTLVVCVLTGLVFAVLPALPSRANLVTRAQGGRSRGERRRLAPGPRRAGRGAGGGLDGAAGGRGADAAEPARTAGAGSRASTPSAC